MDLMNNDAGDDAPTDHSAGNEVAPNNQVLDNNQVVAKRVLINNLRNNTLAFRGFILSQVISGSDIWPAYLNTCRVIQDVNLDYPEFEEAFVRLSKGEPIDFIPRIRNEKATFAELPVKVFLGIFQNLNLSTQYKFRRVSKKICGVIDSLSDDINIGKFEVAFPDRSIVLKYDDFESVYEIDGEGCRVKKQDFSQNYQEKAFEDLQTLLNNPRVRIDSFGVNTSHMELPARFGALLQATREQNKPLLHVKQINLERFFHQPEIIVLLNLIRPDTVTEIQVDHSPLEDHDFSGLAELPYWNNIPLLKLGAFMLEPDQLRYLLHFKKISFSAVLYSNVLFESIRQFENMPNLDEFTISDKLEADFRDYFADHINGMEADEEGIVRFRKNYNNLPTFDICIEKDGYSSKKLRPFPVIDF